MVIEALEYKGLMVLPPGNILTDEVMNTAFQQNRSIACSIESVQHCLPSNAVLLLTTTNSSVDQSTATRNHIIDISKDNILEQFEAIVENCNMDVGDRKSNSSGMEGGPTPYNCAYCRYLIGDTASNERTVYESEHFFVMPTVGQFTTGYLLIIPKEHVMSNAELSSNVIKEFREVLSDIETILTQTYHKSVLIWENGSGNSGIGKAKDSIVHSHVHIVPSNISCREIEVLSQFPFEDVTLDTLHLHKEHSYLLIRTPIERKWRIVDSSKLYVPRQYIRQVVAEEYGYTTGEYWNWRKYPYREKMAETIEDISKYLKENWSNLSTRIQQNTIKFLK